MSRASDSSIQVRIRMKGKTLIVQHLIFLMSEMSLDVHQSPLKDV